MMRRNNLMQHIELNVEGMMCERCENRIENSLSMIDGVKNVKASRIDKKVTIDADDNVNQDEIVKRIEDLDYEVVE